MGAFREAMKELGLRPETVTTDYSPESGAVATRRLLTSPEPPTAIIFDSDLLAVTGLGVAQQMGFAVPGDVSIVGWDDSLISQVVHPPLTAITRDIAAYGILATRHLLDVIDEQATGDRRRVVAHSRRGAAPDARGRALTPARPRERVGASDVPPPPGPSSTRVDT